MKKYALLLICTWLGSALATNTPTANKVTTPELTLSIMNQVITPQVQALQTAANELNQSTAALCQQPSEANLQQAQQAYLRTFSAWQQIGIAPLGPSKQPPTMRLFTTPARSTAELAKQSQTMPSHPMTDGEAHDYGSQLPDGYLGLPVIASVLFSDTPLSLLQQDSMCAYINWQAKTISRQVTILQYEWQGLIRGAAYDIAYPGQLMTEYLQALEAGSQRLASFKPQDSARPNIAQEVNANIAGLSALITGANGIGLDDYLLSRQHQSQWLKTQKQLSALQQAGQKLTQHASERNAKQISIAAQLLNDTLRSDVATALRRN
ncbi:imelysin family protein [uncultured Deefgea sp.]|uniref:imelysin family protein n=1 Tax=uncultured Deefgea sp. TaxID=1304914 RepID=UPI0026294ADA|nr:imelysin family protein [uncultured Deefgea sp.]